MNLRTLILAPPLFIYTRPMINFLYIIFWISLCIIFYNYVGYAVLLLAINKIKGLFGREKPSFKGVSWPTVTLVVAAYNEEQVIREKIHDCFRLDYPENKLFFLYVTDGSDDHTSDIVAEYPQIRLLDSPVRKGKTAALNRAMQQVTTPITVFCDANTLLNPSAIKRIVRHYLDPGTGGVAGEKRVMAEGNGQTSVGGEGLYWKYESFLKRLDSKLYTVTGAAGELFSIRTSLWQPVAENVILDDFVISARVNLKGYRVAYEPEAWASELPSASLKEEKKRKVRISAGAFQAMGMLKPLFNVFRHPVLFFQFFSHRFLRWTLTPLSFPLVFLTNLLLVASGAEIFYQILLVGQIVFYLLALTGLYLTGRTACPKILKIFHYLLFMNYSVYLGFLRFLRGGQPATWEKAGREVAISA